MNEKIFLKKPKAKIAKIQLFLSRIISVLLVSVALFVSPIVFYSSRSLPKTKIAGVDVGNLNSQQIVERLEKNVKSPNKLTIKVDNKTVELNLSDIDFSYDFSATAIDAISLSKKGLNFYRNAFFGTTNNAGIPLRFNLDQKLFEEFLTILDLEYSSPGTPYSVEVNKGKIKITNGKKGLKVNLDRLRDDIFKNLSYNLSEEIVVQYQDEGVVLQQEEIETLTKLAEQLIGKKIILKNEPDQIEITDREIVKLLGKDSYHQKNLVDKFVAAKILPNIERPPQNASLVISDGKVKEFLPSIYGVEVEKDRLTKEILDAIERLQSSDIKIETVKIPTIPKKPEVLLSDINNLGISTLIAKGTSSFRGSSPSRIFNIKHAAEKFKDILIAPGETFSFNKVLGDVSALTGYKQAYIIKDGKTVLGDGGGVCQVSSTLFRAVLNAGLNIIERRAHSYRVGYYEQGSPPGFDATVFYPTTDFKFLNDTPAHILIRPIFDAEKYSLTFEIYGTKDSREIEISSPIIENLVPPPEDLYIDDPNLPLGQIKQIDHKAWGAKVSFKYTVKREGKILSDKTFVSNYQPWRSVFLRGIAQNF